MGDSFSLRLEFNQETGHEINKAKPLFKKIEDEVIEAQKEKLYKNLESQEKEVEEVFN